MGAPPLEGDDDEQPQHGVMFWDGYWIDKYEATAASFAAFMEAHGRNSCSHGGGSADCLDATDDDRNIDWLASEAFLRDNCQSNAEGDVGSCAEHPVVEITWYGAGAFCAWQGKELCSEARWERAAKGASHRTYPWGNEPAPADEGWVDPLANCLGYACLETYFKTSPVGRFEGGASPVGCLDMAGNVWEWVEDDWHEGYAHPGRPNDGGPWIDDPRARERIYRGGSCFVGGDFIRTTKRILAAPTVSDASLGLRCCRSPY